MGKLKEQIIINQENSLLPAATWQTQYRGSNDQEYLIYRACAEDMGWQIKTYDEWLNS
jgi:hypothetical protein